MHSFHSRLPPLVFPHAYWLDVDVGPSCSSYIRPFAFHFHTRFAPTLVIFDRPRSSGARVVLHIVVNLAARLI